MSERWQYDPRHLLIINNRRMRIRMYGGVRGASSRSPCSNFLHMPVRSSKQHLTKGIGADKYEAKLQELRLYAPIGK